MDIGLMILIGIPVAAVVIALTVTFRRDIRDRRLAKKTGEAELELELPSDESLDARTAAYSASMSRGRTGFPI
jgi:hypothetical protein